MHNTISIPPEGLAPRWRRQVLERARALLAQRGPAARREIVRITLELERLLKS